MQLLLFIGDNFMAVGSIAKESHGHPCGESTETETGRGDSEVGGRFWNHSRHLTEW